jgi:hypothetical protein
LGRLNGHLYVEVEMQLPEFKATCPVPASRLALADSLFDAMDESSMLGDQGQTGYINLTNFCNVVNRWEPDFSKDAIMSTFRTCGAKAGRLDRTGYYKWITKVLSGLSDSRYEAAMYCILEIAREKVLPPGGLGE